MKPVAEGPDKNTAPKQVRAQNRVKESLPDETGPLSSGPALIQRKCACGGGCPECRGDTIPVQTKLNVGRPDDLYEREADHMADRVMRMPDSASPATIGNSASVTPFVQKQQAGDINEMEDEDESEDAPFIQTKARGSVGDVPTGLGREVQSLTGGRPLPRAERAFFEPRFGRDLSRVRIHTGDTAATTAHKLNARAYTRGHDIAFAPGEYSPATFAGRHLLAHELTHVLQQDGGNTPAIQREEYGPEEVERSRSTPGMIEAGFPPLMISLYNFAISDDELKPQHRALLEEIASLNTRDTLTYHIVGHTDSVDDQDTNDTLSHERAVAVALALEEAGTNAVVLSWRGERMPVSGNDSPTGRTRNRRVDIYISSSATEGGRQTSEMPPGFEPGQPSDETTGFCAEHPLLCGALAGAGVAIGAIVACIVSGTCLPVPVIPPVPPPGGGGGGDGGDTDEGEERTEEERRELPCGHPEMPHTQVDYDSSQNKGVWVKAEPLTRCPPTNGIQGSPARNDDPNWPHGRDCVVARGEEQLWARAHLLHGPANAGETHHLHGPGDERWNIIMTDRSINGLMASRVERRGVDAVDRVRERQQVLSYEVSVEHFTGDYPRPYFGEKIGMKVEQIHPETGARTELYDDTIESNIRRQPPDCPEEEVETEAEITNVPRPDRRSHPTISADNSSPPGPHEECGDVSCGTAEHFNEVARGSLLGKWAWDEESIREGIELEMDHIRLVYADEIRSQQILAMVESMGSGHAGVRRQLATQRAVEILARYRVFRHLSSYDALYSTPSLDARVWGDYAR